ncbi:hypothetical protein [Alloscardovia sp. HMSC034E08]|uniref:hypothetical protein n=1 Tax=Alloscardovia sp. HMSC034E08 TaxID=1739413 RepID=UPI0011D0C39E|nr:hypothetical protein [Alloscardovia sp. HMSC034E08]
MMAELIVGHSNSKHVSGVDFALTLSSIVGAGTFQAPDNNGNYPQAVVQDANTIQIPAGYFFIDGRPIRVPAAEPVTIDNGQTGFKRIDLICAHYQADSDGIETVKFDVLKGRATTGTPVEPSLSSPAWNVESTTNSRKPIARVTLDGLTPTVQITAEKLSSLHNVESQVTSLQATKSTTVRLPYQTGGAYTLTREGNIVTLGGQGTCDSIQNAGNLKVNEAIPAGYRPTAPMSVSWGGNQKMDMLIKTDGTITLLGNAYGWVHIGASWITHDPMPN